MLRTRKRHTRPFITNTVFEHKPLLPAPVCLRLLLRRETRWCSAVTAFHSSRQSINPSLLAFKICWLTLCQQSVPHLQILIHQLMCIDVFSEVCLSTLLLLRTHLLAAGSSLSGSGVISAAAIWTIYREPPTGHTCFYLFLNFCQALTCRLAPSPNDWQAFDFPTLGISAGDHCTERHKSVFYFFPLSTSYFFTPSVKYLCFANCKCFKCLLGEN